MIEETGIDRSAPTFLDLDELEGDGEGVGVLGVRHAGEGEDLAAVPVADEHDGGRDRERDQRQQQHRTLQPQQRAAIDGSLHGAPAARFRGAPREEHEHQRPSAAGGDPLGLGRRRINRSSSRELNEGIELRAGAGNGLTSPAWLRVEAKQPTAGADVPPAMASVGVRWWGVSGWP